MARSSGRVRLAIAIRNDGGDDKGYDEDDRGGECGEGGDSVVSVVVVLR